MSIILFDRQPFSFMSKNLYDLLTKKGLEVNILDWDYVNISSFPFELYYRNKKINLPKIAVIFSKVYTRHTKGDILLINHRLEMLEDSEVYCINPIKASVKAQDKLFSAKILGENEIPIPDTVAINSVDNLISFFEKCSDIILKPVLGHASIDVHRIIKKQVWPDSTENINPLESILVWELLQRYGVICAQRFIHKVGYEYRIQVVDGQAVSSFDKVGTLNNWRSVDYTSEASIQKRVPTQEEIDLAVKSAKLLGLDWAAVDMVNTDEGPIIIEVNPSLNWWFGYNEQAYIFNKTMEETVLDSIFNKII